MRPKIQELEVPKLGTAVLLLLVFIGLLATLRAEPQTPFTVYDNTQLPAAMITASHN
jgi:hypothetical protein